MSRTERTLHRKAVEKNARDNLRAWMDQAKKRGEIYYNLEKVNRSGFKRWITLAVVNDEGRLDFLWPSPSPVDKNEPWKWDNEDFELACKALDFSKRYRCFVMSGCGMDMVFALICNLAYKAYGEEGSSFANSITRTGMSRAEFGRW